ncbi:Rv1733c family protein [Amycolatopsis thermophila]|uniref:Transmembrane protein n=1 Tax=Amycolatopsis thermophila TaxID=206084 RepID=A0ABU0ENJ6_9PSEU|nr:hypothetical protein [Amycolatopsis thermophila]MDQ0376817.1 hypothetical protein [Amycolatopsis thermophila]
MTGPIGRFWRRLHIGRNPLARTSDRVEAALLLVVVLGLLIAIPLAMFTGSRTYGGQLAVSEQQQASRHLVTATLVEDAPTPVPATEGAFSTSGSAGVRAEWTYNGGEPKTGVVAADPGATAGSKVPVWLNEAGDPAPAPISSTDAATTGVLAGIFAWLVAALVLIAAYWVTRFVLDRRRAARWESEWATLGDRWARY